MDWKWYQYVMYKLTHVLVILYFLLKTLTLLWLRKLAQLQNVLSYALLFHHLCLTVTLVPQYLELQIALLCMVPQWVYHAKKSRICQTIYAKYFHSGKFFFVPIILVSFFVVLFLWSWIFFSNQQPNCCFFWIELFQKIRIVGSWSMWGHNWYWWD